jgi:hypothetical protein
VKQSNLIRAALVVFVTGAAACLFADDKPGDNATVAAAKDEAGFQALFDGKTLNHWEGREGFWRVEDGCIVGQTKEKFGGPNTFLVYKGDAPSDFELRFEYRMQGGNSGVQYRSKMLDDNSKKLYRVGGYQADFDANNTFSGIVYDEAGVAGNRGIMAERGTRVTYEKDGQKKVEKLPMSNQELGAAIKKGDWNQYVVIVNGPHLIHKINGNTTSEVIDHSDKALKSGILALQLHAGDPMKVEFRNLRIKKLDGAGAGANR